MTVSEKLTKAQRAVLSRLNIGAYYPAGRHIATSRALAIAIMALRSIESQEPHTHELTLAHQMAQSAREALALIQEVMEP